jgi:uncharacterized membrane protein
MNDAEVYAGATLVGALSGVRSMSPTAMLSQFGNTHSGPQRKAGIEFLNHPFAARTMTGLAIAEAVADKLPLLPKRTQSFSLLGRAITGAISGAALSSSKKRSLLFGGLVGAAGAIGAAYATHELRRLATKNYHVPNPVAGLVEDALVVTSGWLIASRLRAIG